MSSIIKKQNKHGERKLQRMQALRGGTIYADPKPSLYRDTVQSVLVVPSVDGHTAYRYTMGYPMHIVAYASDYLGRAVMPEKAKTVYLSTDTQWSMC